MDLPDQPGEPLTARLGGRRRDSFGLIVVLACHSQDLAAASHRQRRSSDHSVQQTRPSRSWGGVRRKGEWLHPVVVEQRKGEAGVGRSRGPCSREQSCQPQHLNRYPLPAWQCASCLEDQVAVATCAVQVARPLRSSGIRAPASCIGSVAPRSGGRRPTRRRGRQRGESLIKCVAHGGCVAGRLPAERLQA